MFNAGGEIKLFDRLGFNGFGPACFEAGDRSECRVGFDGQQAGFLNRGFVAYRAHFAVVTTVSVNVAAADMIINESIRIMFSSLLYTSSGG